MKFQNPRIKENLQSKRKEIQKKRLPRKVQNQTDIMQHLIVEYNGAMSSKF